MTEIVNAWEAGSNLVLATRLPDGTIKTTTVPASYAVFYKRISLQHGHERQLRDAASVRSVKVEGEWLRVEFVDHIARRAMVFGNGEKKSPLAYTEAYEGDVRPLRRWLADSGASIQRPRVAYLDLETDSRVPFSRKEEARILSWAVVSGESEEDWCGVLEADTDAAELALLQGMFDALARFDLVVAWNGDGFDFPVIEARNISVARRRFELHRWLWLDHMLLFGKMNTAAESGDEKVSMKLNNVARSLGVGEKDDFDASQTWVHWERGGEDREKMVRYNVQDTRLLKRIEEKTGYMELFFALTQVTQMLPNTFGLQPTQQMDGFMLRLAVERKMHFPTAQYRDNEIPYEGAYVMKPAEGMGILRNVHVADFASLYPSIIITWNMSLETRKDMPVNGPIAPGHARSPLNGVTFEVGADGILPEALRTMIKMRKVYNDKKANEPPGTDAWKSYDRISTAYKVAANSFYGVLGTTNSRFYVRAIAESVTKCGRWLIESTIAEARRWKLDTVYGDTDSLFVVGCSEERFAEFVEHCNSTLYPRILGGVGCAHRSTIKLAYEKAFDRVVFVTAKRYAGNYVHYKGKRATADSKPEIKGLEYKRGDTTQLARRLQETAINMILSGEEIVAKYVSLVESSQAHVFADPLPVEEIATTKTLSKELADYEKSRRVKNDGAKFADLPHVAAAKILRARGEEVREGTRIAYVIVDSTADPTVVVPASDYTGEVDRHYIWEKTVYPPTQRLLESAFPSSSSMWTQFGKTRAAEKKARKLEEKAAKSAELGPLFRSKS